MSAELNSICSEKIKNENHRRSRNLNDSIEAIDKLTYSYSFTHFYSEINRNFK